MVSHSYAILTGHNVSSYPLFIRYYNYINIFGQNMYSLTLNDINLYLTCLTGLTVDPFHKIDYKCFVRSGPLLLIRSHMHSLTMNNINLQLT